MRIKLSPFLNSREKHWSKKRYYIYILLLQLFITDTLLHYYRYRIIEQRMKIPTVIFYSSLGRVIKFRSEPRPRKKIISEDAFPEFFPERLARRPRLSNGNVAGGNVKRILHDPPPDVYVHARVRACKCMQAVPNPDQSNPSAGRLARWWRFFSPVCTVGFYRIPPGPDGGICVSSSSYLGPSVTSVRTSSISSFFSLLPPPLLSPPDSCRVPPFAPLDHSRSRFLRSPFPFFLFSPLSFFLSSPLHFLSRFITFCIVFIILHHHHHHISRARHFKLYDGFYRCLVFARLDSISPYSN